MGTLKDPRAERFLQLFHKSGNARRSYHAAGYRARMPIDLHSSSSVDACASKLLKQPKAQMRLQELRALTYARHTVTIDSLIVELIICRDLAVEQQNPRAAIASTLAKARILGFIPTKRERGDPDSFASAETTDDIIEMARRELGDDLAGRIADWVRLAETGEE